MFHHKRRGKGRGRQSIPVRLTMYALVKPMNSMLTVPRKAQRPNWAGSKAALDLRGLRSWLGATALFAALFVTGQFQAWRLLRALGFFLSSNPHSSFFYMLSGVHLFHLGGGLVWFALVLYRLRGPRYAVAGGGRTLSLFATYWHFLGLLWVYVLVLIFVF